MNLHVGLMSQNKDQAIIFITNSVRINVIFSISRVNNNKKYITNIIIVCSLKQLDSGGLWCNCDGFICNFIELTCDFNGNRSALTASLNCCTFDKQLTSWHIIPKGLASQREAAGDRFLQDFSLNCPPEKQL